MKELYQYLVIAPFSLLSTFGNLFIITTFIKHPAINSIYEFQFIFVFSIFDILQDIVLLFPSFSFSSRSPLCIAQGFLLQLFSLADILWIAFIAYAMFRDIVQIRRRFATGFVTPLLVILFFSAFTAILPVVYDAYSQGGPWCWFETPSEPNIVRDYLFIFLLFYAIVWLAISLTLAINLSIYLKIRNEELFDLVGMNTLKRLKWYPWVLCFCYMPITVYRSFQGYAEMPIGVALACFCVIQLKGFFSAIAFRYSDKVKSALSKIKRDSNDASPTGLPLV
jgi:hypothetical protein